MSTENLPETTPEDGPQHEPQNGPQSPPYRTGLSVGTVLLGLLAIALAAYTVAEQLTDIAIDWNRFGPFSALAAGLVLVLLGLWGMTSNRRRRS